MHGARTQQMETVVTTGAAAIFAAAIAYAGLAFGRSLFAQQPIAASAVAATLAFAAFLICRKALGAIDHDLAYPDIRFDIKIVEQMSVAEPEQLVLTDADRLIVPGDGEPFELDDILAELSPDSRVVRLFDPAAMPTPGQLGARIDSHLDGSAPSRPSVDASQDLFEALSELRRSLR